ncbi:MAG: outer membrane lipoprotein carrier protein LolA [Fimbriimonadales bacterium]
MILLITLLSVLRTSQTSADTRSGQALIDESAAKLKSAKSLTFTLTATEAHGPHLKEQVKILRGGYESTTSDLVVMISTPKGSWNLYPKTKMYSWSGPHDSKAWHSISGLESLDEAPIPLRALSGPLDGKLGKKTTVRVEVKSTDPVAKEFVLFDPKTKLPMGDETTGPTSAWTYTYEDFNLDARLKPEDFDWVPPADWTKMAPQKPAPRA